MAKVLGIDSLKVRAGDIDPARNILEGYLEFGMDLLEYTNGKQIARSIYWKISEKYQMVELRLMSDLYVSMEETEYFLRRTWFEYRPREVKYDGMDYEEYVERVRVAEEEWMEMCPRRQTGLKTKGAK